MIFLGLLLASALRLPSLSSGSENRNKSLSLGFRSACIKWTGPEIVAIIAFP